MRAQVEYEVLDSSSSPGRDSSGSGGDGDWADAGGSPEGGPRGAAYVSAALRGALHTAPGPSAWSHLPRGTPVVGPPPAAAAGGGASTAARPTAAAGSQTDVDVELRRLSGVTSGGAARAAGQRVALQEVDAASAALRRVAAQARTPLERGSDGAVPSHPSPGDLPHAHDLRTLAMRLEVFDRSAALVADAFQQLSHTAAGATAAGVGDAVPLAAAGEALARHAAELQRVAESGIRFATEARTAGSSLPAAAAAATAAITTTKEANGGAPGAAADASTATSLDELRALRIETASARAIAGSERGASLTDIYAELLRLRAATSEFRSREAAMAAELERAQAALYEARREGLRQRCLRCASEARGLTAEALLRTLPEERAALEAEAAALAALAAKLDRAPAAAAVCGPPAQQWTTMAAAARGGGSPGAWRLWPQHTGGAPPSHCGAERGGAPCGRMSAANSSAAALVERHVREVAAYAAEVRVGEEKLRAAQEEIASLKRALVAQQRRSPPPPSSAPSCSLPPAGRSAEHHEGERSTPPPVEGRPSAVASAVERHRLRRAAVARALATSVTRRLLGWRLELPSDDAVLHHTLAAESPLRDGLLVAVVEDVSGLRFECEVRVDSSGEVVAYVSSAARGGAPSEGDDVDALAARIAKARYAAVLRRGVQPGAASAAAPRSAGSGGEGATTGTVMPSSSAGAPASPLQAPAAVDPLQAPPPVPTSVMTGAGEAVGVKRPRSASDVGGGPGGPGGVASERSASGGSGDDASCTPTPPAPPSDAPSSIRGSGSSVALSVTAPSDDDDDVDGNGVEQPSSAATAAAADDAVAADSQQSGTSEVAADSESQCEGYAAQAEQRTSGAETSHSNGQHSVGGGEGRKVDSSGCVGAGTEFMNDACLADEGNRESVGNEEGEGPAHDAEISELSALSAETPDDSSVTAGENRGSSSRCSGATGESPRPSRDDQVPPSKEDDEQE